MARWAGHVSSLRFGAVGYLAKARAFKCYTGHTYAKFTFVTASRADLSGKRASPLTLGVDVF